MDHPILSRVHRHLQHEIPRKQPIHLSCGFPIGHAPHPLTALHACAESGGLGQDDERVLVAIDREREIFREAAVEEIRGVAGVEGQDGPIVEDADAAGGEEGEEGGPD